jgi:hypothetical protein
MVVVTRHARKDNLLQNITRMPVKSAQYFVDETCGGTNATFPLCADLVKENMYSEYQSY